MDHLKQDTLYQFQAPNPSVTDHHDLSTPSHVNPSQRSELGGGNDIMAARKLQKADREKLRRDRLNEQFIELGNTLDPDRSKHDKATILVDTVQLLKDLTSQVNKLKAEYATLNEESCELTQEKNDLREEKASLKSDIESLKPQYQQRIRAMYPWGTGDHSVVMAPPSYPFPMPMPMPPGPIPMHPSMHPYPFFGSHSPAIIPNPSPNYVPYMNPNAADQHSTQHGSAHAQPAGRSHVSGRQNSKNKSPGKSRVDKSENSNDITTDLELKTPGSTGDEDLLFEKRTSKESPRKENSVSTAEASSSSRCSSSPSVQNSSSNSIVGSTQADDLDG